MSLVFKTPKSTLNTTSKAIQNLGGDCPPCPEPVLESKELEYTQNGEYTVTPEQGVDGFSQVDITVNIPSDVNNQNKTVSPSTSSQTIEADSGYSGLGTVTVNPVTAAIDQNITAENIKKDVTILGVTGSMEFSVGALSATQNGEYYAYEDNYNGYDTVIVNVQPVLQAKTATPTTSQQVITPDQGKDGLSSVTVSAVTSAIDANIAAGNIKSGVSILGVTGNVVEAKLKVGELLVDNIGTTEFTPGSGYNGFGTAQVTVPSNPAGAIGTPFSSVKNLMIEFESGYLAMDVTDSSFIEGEPGEDNYYTVEDQFGNVITELDAGILNQFTDNPFDFTGRVITVGFDKADVTINEDDSDPNDIKYTYEISTAVLVGINGNLNDESWFDDKGEWLIGRNEYAGGWIYIDGLLGSYATPFDNGYNLDETFLKVNGYDGDVCWNLVNVQSGSIDSETGFYVAEDEMGVTAHIRPYLENPDFDPEQPEDIIDNPPFIFPENFDLTGLEVEVSFDKDQSEVTDNPDYDPEAAEPTPETERQYNVEIFECSIYGINYNEDMDTWEQCYFPPAV